MEKTSAAFKKKFQVKEVSLTNLGGFV